MLWLAASLAVALPLASPAQDWPKTKAEQTNYANTSSHAEVVGFLRELIRNDVPMRLEWIGKSPMGKDIPLVVVAENPEITPFQAKTEGKIVVYVQANIHAGEVEGKEASLMLLREIGQMPHHPLLQKLVLLVAPIYNGDGNDQWGPGMRNRPSQDGPDPVGQRANGQGFDLNRDCMKAESNEMSAILANVYRRWDPEVVMDLHTTNGTRHGYVLTYSPPLNPAMDQAIFKYCRDSLLPRVRSAFQKAVSGNDLFDYGNTSRAGGTLKWETFGWEPRYVTNYAGVRNRLGILSEAASFQPFKVRVEATLEFVKLTFAQVARDAKKVIDMCRSADRTMKKWAESEKPVLAGIRFEMDQRGKEKVWLEKANPNPAVAHNKAPKDLEFVEMPVFDRFKVTRTARFPAAYVLTPDCRSAAELLARHGVRVDRLTEDWTSGGDFFEVKEAVTAGQAFQGHRLVRLEGSFRSAKARFPKGSFIVRTGQPLGMLIFHMLEPESLDGVIAWGLLGMAFPTGESLPIVKAYPPFIAPTEAFNPDSWR